MLVAVKDDCNLYILQYNRKSQLQARQCKHIKGYIEWGGEGKEGRGRKVCQTCHAHIHASHGSEYHTPLQYELQEVC